MKLMTTLLILFLLLPTLNGCSKNDKIINLKMVNEELIDQTINPCDNFYQYACGRWIKKTKIPDDQADWYYFSQIDENTRIILRGILTQFANGKIDKTIPYSEQLGAFYSSCMDRTKSEQQGEQWILNQLASMEKFNIKSLNEKISNWHKIGARLFFGFYPIQDQDNAAMIIGEIGQDGLGLPNKEFYQKRDKKSEEILDNYLAHIKKSFQLSKINEIGSAEKAFQFEVKLAEISLSPVELRDPIKLHNPATIDQIQKKMTLFNWRLYFENIGRKQNLKFNLQNPDYLSKLDALLANSSIEEIKYYIIWRLIDEYSTRISKKLETEKFNFQSQNLSGAKKIPERWKRCIAETNRYMGEAVGQAYVAKMFTPESKKETKLMVAQVEKAFKKDLNDAVLWMDKKTKISAIEKLEKINNKIGYPDKWKEYEKLKVDRESFITNIQRGEEFEFFRQIGKVGKPVDRDEWFMTPQTDNAYYDASMNEIVFPAGILQPPLYDFNASRAANWGATGSVVGHELTHGFDDEGRNFDGGGNLKAWWSGSSDKNFKLHTQCLIDQYNNYPVGDLKVNGELTLGENIADLGGLKISYQAYKGDTLSHEPRNWKSSFTNDQEFFISFAQSWCYIARAERARTLIKSDPHSPPEFRVNGALANFPDFFTAFNCPANNKMASKIKCEIW